MYRGSGAASDGWIAYIRDSFNDLGYSYEEINEYDIQGGILMSGSLPAYDVVCFHAGSGTVYNSALGTSGKDEILSFMNAGGNYVGTCAGAYFGSAGPASQDCSIPLNNYLALWPGRLC